MLTLNCATGTNGIRSLKSITRQTDVYISLLVFIKHSLHINHPSILDT